MELKWTRDALEDMEDILMYIAKDNVERAISFTDELITCPEILKDNPFIGVRYSDNYPENIRLLIYKSYNIIYEVDIHKNSVIIHVVYHHARLPKLER